MKTKDVIGVRIGRLTFIRFVGRDKKRENRRIFLVRCDCGTEKEHTFYGANNRNILSCGCTRKASLLKANTKHGMAHDRFYRTFHGMKVRCSKKNDVNYKNYGAKGIKVLWSSFLEFKKDMYKDYLKHVKKHGEKQTTIDRIDNKKHYSKENCRWATYGIQRRNTSLNRWLMFRGKKMVFTDVCNALKIKQHYISTMAKSKRITVIEAILYKVKDLSPADISQI